MAAQKLAPLDQITGHIKAGRNFVLQGGAGSGKTETLRQVIELVSSPDLKCKIACITHTNKAADEISARVLGDHSISTIHSFLLDLIKPFKTNIKSVLPDIFTLEAFIAHGDEHYGGDVTKRKLEEHKSFKKLHEKAASRRFSIFLEKTEKVVGKPQYDKDPDTFNNELNELIGRINDEIIARVNECDPSAIAYNETKFNNLRDFSYGHDGLIQIACSLFDKFPILLKIVSERFDCIFIDEFQDANPDVVRVLLDVTENRKLIVGLFGDSEQAIYEDGIGDVQSYIDSGALELIPKLDNYRCSQEVIDFANSFRCDGLKQEIALKKLPDGSTESFESREGSVVLYYSIAPELVDTGNAKEDKELHADKSVSALDALVSSVSSKHNEFVQLKLTNKSIANDVGFGKLLDIFTNRYLEPRDKMKKILDRLQFGQIIEVLDLFGSLPGDRRSYNKLISRFKKTGLLIKSVADKNEIETKLKLITDGGRGAYEAIELAIEIGIISQSETHQNYISRRDLNRAEFDDDKFLNEFEELYLQGHNTKLRMQKAVDGSTDFLLNAEKVDDDFDGMLNMLKQKRFNEELFSADLKLSEILNFYKYEQSDGNFATMHKTKGTGIENVVVILDEYGWTSKYDFASCFSGCLPITDREKQSRKLLYVACSRTKKNLVCVLLAADQDHANRVAAFFPKAEKIDIAI